MVTLRIVKIGWKPQDVVLMKGSKKDIKNGNYMMINHDIATVREFMFCKVGLCRLFLQLIKEKLTNFNKFPPLNYHKILIPPPFFCPPYLNFRKKFLPLTCLVWNLVSPSPTPLYKGVRTTTRTTIFADLLLNLIHTLAGILISQQIIEIEEKNESYQ